MEINFSPSSDIEGSPSSDIEGSNLIIPEKAKLLLQNKIQYSCFVAWIFANNYIYLSN